MGVVNTVLELRAAKGLTQHELAVALGVSRQTINSVERGRFEPSLSLALAIAAYFSRPFEQVFMLEGMVRGHGEAGEIGFRCRELARISPLRPKRWPVPMEQR